MQITFDDEKTLADFNMVVLKGYEKSLMPSISGNTTAIPGRTGLWDYGNELGALSDTYPIACLSQEPIVRERNLSAFYKYITDTRGHPRLLKLTLSIEPHLYFMAKLEKPKAPKRYNSGADFELSIIATNPRKYSRFKSEEVRWGSGEINFTFPYQLGNRGLESNIEIIGNMSIPVKIEGFDLKPRLIISGSGTNVTITNKDQQIKLGTFSKSEIEIDCEHYVTIINGKETFVNFDDFNLFSGLNNVKVQGQSMNFNLTFDFLNEF